MLILRNNKDNIQFPIGYAMIDGELRYSSIFVGDIHMTKKEIDESNKKYIKDNKIQQIIQATNNKNRNNIKNIFDAGKLEIEEPIITSVMNEISDEEIKILANTQKVNNTGKRDNVRNIMSHGRFIAEKTEINDVFSNLKKEEIDLINNLRKTSPVNVNKLRAKLVATTGASGLFLTSGLALRSFMPANTLGFGVTMVLGVSFSILATYELDELNKAKKIGKQKQKEAHIKQIQEERERMEKAKESVVNPVVKELVRDYIEEKIQPEEPEIDTEMLYESLGISFADKKALRQRNELTKKM